jgi:hypothetical protein
MINNGHIGHRCLRNLKRKANEATNNPCGIAAGIGGSVCVNHLRPVEAGGGVMKDEALKLAIGKIKSARDCHFAAIDPLLFEAEEILEQALAAQQEHEPENEPFVSLASVQEPVQATMKLESSGPGHGPAPNQKLSVRHVSLIDAGKTPPVQPAVPDALNPKDENPAYAAGWNDCRAEMLKGMKP